MDFDFNNIADLLSERAECNARLKNIPYDGTPEVKELNGSKYLYCRKRIGSRVTSSYVGSYSEELHQLLLRSAKEARDLRRSLRHIEKALASQGYSENDLSPKTSLNIDFARANLKANIYDQAVLEGVATSFPQTEEIIENGIVSGVRPTDVQKILNLKHAWEFILDKDILISKTNHHFLCHIARLVNEGFFYDGGRIRGVPVTIGGSSYVPPIPFEFEIKERIDEVLSSEDGDIDKAVELCLFCMRTQIFNDGNKRAAVIFANHYMVSHGLGLLVIPEAYVPEFKKLLVEFYESNNSTEISSFMKERCWRKL